MSDDHEGAVPKHQKYSDAHARYQATLYRSTYAIRKEYEQGLNAMVDLSGAGSVSNLLAMLARKPAAFADMLRPAFEELQSDAPRQRRRLKPGVLGLDSDDNNGESVEDQLRGIAPLELLQRK